MYFLNVTDFSLIIARGRPDSSSGNLKVMPNMKFLLCLLLTVFLKLTMLSKNLSLLHIQQALQKPLSTTYLNMLYKNLFLLHISTCSTKTSFYCIFQHALQKPLSTTYFNILYKNLSLSHIQDALQKPLSTRYLNMLYKNLFLLHISTLSTKTSFYYIFQHAPLKPLTITYFNILY